MQDVGEHLAQAVRTGARPGTPHLLAVLIAKVPHESVRPESHLNGERCRLRFAFLAKLRPAIGGKDRLTSRVAFWSQTALAVRFDEGPRAREVATVVAVDPEPGRD